MYQGTVKFYNKEKKFGFIVADDQCGDLSGKDIYVHETGLQEEVKQGDVVSFDTKPGQKGKPDKAVNVRKA